MDETDKAVLAALRRNARISLKDLALQAGVTRATARVRLERLEASGEIAGYTVITKSDLSPDSVRGLMSLEIKGSGVERIIAKLLSIPEVFEVHSTNGAWDLIAELRTDTLERFDRTLVQIREIPGITGSETNLLLSTKRRRARR